MRNFNKSLTILALFAFSATACTKKEEAADGPAAEKQTEAKVAVESATPAANLTLPELSPEEPKTKLGELPVSEDLEDEAEKSVNLDNIDLELDRLQAEIDG